MTQSETRLPASTSTMTPRPSKQISAAACGDTVLPMTDGPPEHDELEIPTLDLPELNRKRKRSSTASSQELSKRSKLAAAHKSKVDEGKVETTVDLTQGDDETNEESSKWPNLNAQDIDRLPAHSELNDAVIHACLEGLVAIRHHIYTIAPWLVQSVVNKTHGKLFPNVGNLPGETDGLFCLNIAGNHWVCVHLVSRMDQVTIYDSLGYNETRQNQAIRTVRALGCDAPWWEFIDGKCPLQPNTYDCGIYALATAYHLAYDLEIPSEFNARLWRWSFYAFLTGRYLELCDWISPTGAEEVMDWRALPTGVTKLSKRPRDMYDQMHHIAKVEIREYETARVEINIMVDAFEQTFGRLWAKQKENNSSLVTKDWEKLRGHADCKVTAVREWWEWAQVREDWLTGYFFNSYKEKKSHQRNVKRRQEVEMEAVPKWEKLKADTEWLVVVSDQYRQLQQEIRKRVCIDI